MQTKSRDLDRLDRLADETAKAIRSGDWQSARRDAAEILRHRPMDLESLFALGLAHAALGEFGPAEDRLRRLLVEQPQHAGALYCMGNVRFEQKDSLGAVEYLQKAVLADPRNHAAWARLGFALESMGRRREAIPAYRNALETSPNPGGWRLDVGGLDFTPEVQEALERLTAAS